MAKLLTLGTIGATSVSTIATISVAEPSKTMMEITVKQGLEQKSDAGEIEALVDEVIAANPKAVEDATSDGKKSKKAIGFLMGQVMQKSRGQANPKVVSAILSKKLG